MIFDRHAIVYSRLPPGTPPLLVVVVDTEEEFDWSRPHARANTQTESIAAQSRAQEVFERFGVVPTYVVDYPVAANEAAARFLRGYLERGGCDIGAHLHPWVNPPHEEAVTVRNTYPGNLPPELEREKLVRLTRAIAENLGRRPTVYRAGRYGLGPHSAEILEDLGYEVDTSLVPRTSFADDGGPDFRAFDHRPFWFGQARRLLEIPLSAGFAGLVRGWGPRLFPLVAGAAGLKLHVPGIAARLGLLERIRLTPEGIDHGAHRRLTASLIAEGCRVFVLSYHSPSLEPGNTPYVRDRDELATFLATLERYLDYFLGELGGEATTPSALYRRLAAARAEGRPGAESA